MTADHLLAVEGLRTHVRTDEGTTRAVDGVSFTVDRGETVCLVGESGSGKTVTTQSLTRIVPTPPADIVDGSVTFDGTDLLAADDATLRSVRGDRIAHVFQDPQRALDPVYTVGEQIVEAIRIHREVSRAAARERGVELLGRVGIPRPAVRIDDYPHEFSQGMCQRVAVAVALAADPDLIVADEPTTALDVTVQARLLDLLSELTGDDTALLLVTHDLRVVAAVADRVLVMYGGTVVERGPTAAVFERPAHPYTQALFDSFRGLPASEDSPARVDVPIDGCRFREECPHAESACEGGEQPAFHPVDGDEAHAASCVYYAADRDPGPILAEARSLTESAVSPAGEDDGIGGGADE
ncbi:MAG: ABC transporter ATP-binding protein [Haloarculaceae archaeon]